MSKQTSEWPISYITIHMAVLNLHITTRTPNGRGFSMNRRWSRVPGRVLAKCFSILLIRTSGSTLTTSPFLVGTQPTPTLGRMKAS